MTVTSFTELEVFSCLSFNILNEDLSGKVDKISTIIDKISWNIEEQVLAYTQTK